MSLALLGALLTLAAPLRTCSSPGFSERARKIAVMIIVGLAFLFAFIDNGFLRGTRGPNRYGPDPLNETA